MDNFFFIGLPYASLLVMLVGSIYKYKSSEYGFTSFSSQFLEGNTLHKCVRLFHWGILALFMGHLIAFLFPASVLAWNGHTLRLLIIEMSAFGFGLTAFYGIVILIYRRIKYERIRMVTSKADVCVYSILLIQIISGLWVAYFTRWGSSWFAAVLTPYLRSLIFFSPDIAAVELLPLAVKIHIISAFTIVGMIPFTRFVHFLVYPFEYFVRKSQRVIWNWDRKKIRTSKKILPDIKPVNN